METKSSIRKKILAHRNAMTLEECRKKSKDIMQNVLSIPLLQKAEFVLCYASYKSEVMTGDLIDTLLKMRKQIYCPRVSGDEMDFYHITNLKELTKGYKGIPEPSMDCVDVFTVNMWEENKERVVMLLPGAVFSESGSRIGYGKGYYDRYLMRIPCMERIAVCYEMQVVEELPVDPHDIPVTTIVTEDRVRHIIRKQETKSYYI